MSRVVVSNTLSFSFYGNFRAIVLDAKRINMEEAKRLVKNHPVESIVDHERTAALLTNILGVEIQFK